MSAFFIILSSWLIFPKIINVGGDLIIEFVSSILRR